MVRLPRRCLGAGVHNLLQQRLTAQAADELQQLNSLLDDVSLDGTVHQRTSFYQDGNGKLMSSVIYRASTREEQPCPSFKFV